jgi:hypothetical protein
MVPGWWGDRWGKVAVGEAGLTIVVAYYAQYKYHGVLEARKGKTIRNSKALVGWPVQDYDKGNDKQK